MLSSARCVEDMGEIGGRLPWRLKYEQKDPPNRYTGVWSAGKVISTREHYAHIRPGRVLS